MLDDRGYNIVTNDHSLTPDERVQLREFPILAMCSITGSIAAVWVVKEPKMSVQSMRILMDLKDTIPRLRKVLAIVPEAVTHFARREQDDDVEIFKCSELMFNVSRHSMVPQAAVVTDVPALLTKYNTTLCKLPCIYNTDPLARYWGWPVGTVLQMTRELLGSTQVYYRLVIPNT
jgi:DNA-directed RNA polymerase subunit H (RpoH/RPB5)